MPKGQKQSWMTTTGDKEWTPSFGEGSHIKFYVGTPEQPADVAGIDRVTSNSMTKSAVRK